MKTDWHNLVEEKLGEENESVNVDTLYLFEESNPEMVRIIGISDVNNKDTQKKVCAFDFVFNEKSQKLTVEDLVYDREYESMKNLIEEKSKDLKENLKEINVE